MSTKNSLTASITFQDKTVSIKVKKAAIAKRMSIKPSYKDYGARVTIPKYTSYNKGLEFAKQNLAWVFNLLSQHQSHNIITLKQITLLGKTFMVKTINVPAKPKISLTNTHLIISGNLTNHDELSKALIAFFKRLAKEYFVTIINRQTSSLKVKYKKVIIRDSETRWGSCSSLKNISLNWRLIFAPRTVIDYVISHEVAHLLHFNHSKQFWHTLEKLHPNMQVAKTWLKQNGNSLYNIIL